MKFFGVVLAVTLAIVALAVADDSNDKALYEQKRDLARVSFDNHRKAGCGTADTTKAISDHMTRCDLNGGVQEYQAGAECFDAVIREIEHDMEHNC